MGCGDLGTAFFLVLAVPYRQSENLLCSPEVFSRIVIDNELCIKAVTLTWVVSGDLFRCKKIRNWIAFAGQNVACEHQLFQLGTEAPVLSGDVVKHGGQYSHHDHGEYYARYVLPNPAASWYH